MIKPKSRAHEDRIKALEAEVETLRERVWLMHLEFSCPRKPWWKRLWN